MHPEELKRNYFSPNTRGYSILYNFYFRYKHLFASTLYPEFEEFLHQVYLNISGIDYSKVRVNAEAYIIGSIKIQCRAQLDKSIRFKKHTGLESLKKYSEDDEPGEIEYQDNSPGPHDILEAQEIISLINLFKLSLNRNELKVFNSIIDAVPRQETAVRENLNINTLDTLIRRIRIKFFHFLKEKGYSLELFKRYEKK
ncbi:MAG: hypothetical protein Kow0098_22240 [Ignavibacteriaceae bacterium]